jgi:hypothetical protein
MINTRNFAGHFIILILLINVEAISTLIIKIKPFKKYKLNNLIDHRRQLT